MKTDRCEASGLDVRLSADLLKLDFREHRVRADCPVCGVELPIRITSEILPSGTRIRRRFPEHAAPKDVPCPTIP